MSDRNGRGSQWDFVGAWEAGQILGVEPPRITKYRVGDKNRPHIPPRMPAIVKLAAGPVWTREQVFAVGRGEQCPPGPDVELMGLVEVAKYIDVDKRQIHRYRSAGRFPEPVAELKMGPIWLAADIEIFAREREERRAARA